MASYAAASKRMAGVALKSFCDDWGVPQELIMDGAGEQAKPGTKFMKICRKENIKVHLTEPQRPQPNPAEHAIREMKKKWYRIAFKKKVPRRLWDYGYKWVCEIMQHQTLFTALMEDAL